MAYRRHARAKIILGAALAIIMTLILAWCVLLVRDKLLLNADRMGSSLAPTYAAEEDNRFSVYEYFLGFGYTYLTEMAENGATEDEMQDWMTTFSDHLDEVTRSEIISPYAVVDGKIIAGTPWEGDDTYDYSSAQWYTNAQANPNTITYSDVYDDVITGQPMVTLSICAPRSGDVIAFDIRLDMLNAQRGSSNVPIEGSYFLFDRQGTLIYASTDLDLNSSTIQNYLNTLYSGILADTDDTDLMTITGADGSNRNVYYSRMENGWLSVITIPTQSILQEGWDSTLLAIVGVFIAVLAIAIIFVVRASIQERRARHTADTLRLLGDTFYAIYRVDYRKGTYEMIKGSSDVNKALGPHDRHGDYRHLIQTVKQFVDERTYAEFEKSFSLENIRSLVDEGVAEFGGDFRRHFPDGVRWVSIRIIHNSDLRLNEVIMCFRDIDSEKKRELARKELLENALASARQTVERKTSYFNNASHDMRTPLNAIIGLARLAERDFDDQEKVRDYLGKIQNAGEQMLGLVNDVLDVSRLEHGDGGMVNYQPMSLHACLKSTLDLFNDRAKREGKTLEQTIDVVDDHVYGDSKRIGQILNNLVSNALKYSYEGAQIHVRLREIARSDRTAKYKFDVSDTGIGMSEEFLEQVFEPFARETMFAPTGVTGTGLGMPIVKSLVQQMSGEISVRSKLGEGTTFTIVVPMQVVEEEIWEAECEKAASRGKARAQHSCEHQAGDEAAPSENEDHASNSTVQNEGEETSADPQATGLAGTTILVAEDNDINMLIATELLHGLGASTLEARNGKEALKLFADSGLGVIDAILMDMKMPVMDGCDAARAIRALEREDASTVPIIAVTANAFAEDIAQTVDAGMDGHVAKPFTAEELTEALLQALHR